MPTADEGLDKAVRDWWNREYDGGFTLGFIIVAEGTDETGKRWLDFCWSEDLQTWTLKGYLRDALDSQLIGATADAVNEDK